MTCLQDSQQALLICLMFCDLSWNTVPATASTSVLLQLSTINDYGKHNQKVSFRATNQMHENRQGAAHLSTQIMNFIAGF
jgi:hypothetical protein